MSGRRNVVEALIVEHRALAEREAAQFCRANHIRGGIVEDVEADALESLWRAARVFRGGTFRAFAVIVIRRRLMNLARSEQRWQRTKAALRTGHWRPRT